VTETSEGEALRGAELAGLYGKPLCVLGVRLQATDAVVIASVLFFDLLLLIFHGRVRNPWSLLAKNALYLFLYAGAVVVLPRISNRVLRFFVRTGSVQLIFGYLFLSVLPMQLIFVRTWQDPAVLRLEQSVFGAQPTIWLQRFVSPALTEWMMFAYVIYLVIYPALSALICFKRGENAMEDYLFTLALANVLCCLGFLAYPVASPMYFMPETYTVPLKGFFFTAAGEFIRTHLHQIGGSIPSPHTAIATVMWAMAYRYYRPAFYGLAPVILSLYVSTFYCRYHYVTDTVFGVLAAAVCLLAAPPLMRRWNGAVGRRLARMP